MQTRYVSPRFVLLVLIGYVTFCWMLCNDDLCAARRKQKWSVDPRNSAWSKDENKFGQRMLERMGWSKGKVRVKMCWFVFRDWQWTDELLNISVTCYVFSFLCQGLGRSEQGSTDHIKVKVKNNNHGLGTTASYEVSTCNTLWLDTNFLLLLCFNTS